MFRSSQSTTFQVLREEDGCAPVSLSLLADILTVEHFFFFLKKSFQEHFPEANARRLIAFVSGCFLFPHIAKIHWSITVWNRISSYIRRTKYFGETGSHSALVCAMVYSILNVQCVLNWSICAQITATVYRTKKPKFYIYAWLVSSMDSRADYFYCIEMKGISLLLSRLFDGPFVSLLSRGWKSCQLILQSEDIFKRELWPIGRNLNMA